MKIILFPGQSKTGTSTLQRHMVKSADALLAQGVLYPRAGRLERGVAHHRFAASFMAPRSVPAWVPPLAPAAWRKQVEREIAATGAHTLVLASEMLLFSDVRALVAALPPAETRAVIALRRQDLHLDASVQHQMKTLAYRTFDDARLARRRATGRLDYDTTVRRWERAVDSVEILPFESSLFGDGLMHRLLTLAGLTPWPGMVEPAPENVRLGRDAVELLHRLHFDLGMSRSKALSLRPALTAWSREHPDPAEWRHVLPPALRRRLLDEAEAGNAAIHARHPWSGRDALFMNRDVDQTYAPYPGLSATTAASLHAALSPGVTDPALREALDAACRSA